MRWVVLGQPYILAVNRITVIALFCLLFRAAALWSGQAEEALEQGVKLHDAGKPKEAIREYNRAIKANPKLI